jgi:hypothetical protein
VENKEEALMPNFRVTLVEVETLLSTYDVDAESVDNALKALALNGNSYARLDAESLEYKFLRFKQVWNPDSGENHDLTDEENKQLLGENYRA